MSEVDLRTEILGSPSLLPLALAPTGGTALVRSGGDVDIAAAAGVLGIPCTVSTMASRSLEETSRMWRGPMSMSWKNLH